MEAARRGDPVMVRQIPGHLARDYDGHGVVGGAQVGEAHHAGDAELGRLSFCSPSWWRVKRAIRAAMRSLIHASPGVPSGHPDRR